MNPPKLATFLLLFILCACSIRPTVVAPSRITMLYASITATILPHAATSTSVPLTTPSVSSPVISEQCVSTIATGSVAKGAIVLYDNLNISLILKRRNDVRIPEQPNLDNTVLPLAVSPSEPYFSYREQKQGNYFLVIRQADGTIIQKYAWPHMSKAFDDSFEYFSQWMKPNTILFRADDFQSTVKLFLVDIDTGEAQELFTNFPQLASGQEINWGIDNPAIHIHNFKGANVIYDPTLTRVVYPKTGGIATLYDVQQKIELASRPLKDATAPEWSPDGKLFVIKAKTNSNTGEPGDELFIVPRDGPAFTPLTHLTDLYPGVSIGAYSWSPDSQKIAFWIKQKDDREYSLAVIDIHSGAMTNYCITGIASQNNELSSGSHPGPVVGTGKPVWSPDQTQLLISQFDESHKHINVILVDLALGQAFKIKQDVEPIGWMKEP